MASIINTNMASLMAQRNLSKSQGAQADAMQRLSSGLRINTAKDDAAGLAISTRFSSQTQGLAVAIRNSGDGISLAQTAEGALGTMTESLQRVRELALQAANGTNSASDREALNAEAQQMIAEITRTATETNFNGQKLLDGSFDTKFQVGANAGETIDVRVADLGVDTLGVSDQAGVSAVGTDSALGNGDLIINGVEISSSSAADDDASTENAAASAIAKVAAINKHTDESGVRAVVDENTVAGSTQTAAAVTGQSLTLNNVSIQVDTTGDASTTRAAVASAINAVSDQTGVRAIDTGDAATGVTLETADGRNIELDYGTGGLNSANTGLAAGNTYEGGYTLIAEGDTKEISIQGGNGTGNGNLANAGLSKGSYTPGVSAVSSSLKTSTAGTAAVAATNATATIDLAAFAGTGTDVSQTLTLNGTEVTITKAAADAAYADDGEAVTALAAQFTAAGYTLTDAGGDDDKFTITSIDAGIGQTVAAGTTGTSVTIDASTNGADAVLNSSTTATLDLSAFNSATTATPSVIELDFSDLLNDNTGGGGDLTREFDIGAETISVVQDDGGGGAGQLAADGTATFGDIQTALNAAITAAAGIGPADFTIEEINAGSNDGLVRITTVATGSTAPQFAATGGANDVTIDDNTDGADAAAITQTISLDGNDVTLTKASGEAAWTDADIVSNLNSQLTAAGFTLSDSNAATENGAITLEANTTGDSRTIALTTTGSDVALAAGTSITAGAAATDVPDRNLNAGDLVINNVAIKASQASDDNASYADAGSSSKTGSGISIAAAINKSTGETGVSASVNATEFVGGSSTTAGTVGNTGAVWVNGVEVSLTTQTDAGSNRAHALEQINKVSGQTGVTATDNGESLTLTAADGRNIVLAFDTNAADDGGVAASDFGLGGSAGIDSSDITANSVSLGDSRKSVADDIAQTTYSKVTLTGAGDIEVGAGINGSTALDELGFTAGSFGGGEDGTFLKDIDLTTVEGANAALTAIDNALDTVNAQRADLGAIQNRFETTVKNLQVSAENLTSANSRIRDADFAAETAELSRARVLQQAGTSILAQANALPNQVLSLLQ